MSGFLTILFPLFGVAVVVGMIFLIKYLIRYNARVQKKKDPQQEELDRMKLNDL